MNRVQALVDYVAERRLVDAAIERFHRSGYVSTQVHEIAADAGLPRAGFYAHFPSKQAILAEIAASTYGLGVAEVEAAVAGAGDDPRDRLDAAIWSHCGFAIRCRHALQVTDAELLMLDLETREYVRAARARLAELIGEIIADGALSGVFSVARPAIVSQALAGMCASISTSYDDSVAQAPRQTAEAYCALATRMAGAAEDVAPARLAVVPGLLTA